MPAPRSPSAPAPAVSMALALTGIPPFTPMTRMFRTSPAITSHRAGSRRFTEANASSIPYDPTRAASPAERPMSPVIEIPWSARPARATPHQCTLRCSKGRRLPPTMNPTKTAKPITMRTNIMRGSLRLGRLIRQHRSTALGESPVSKRRYPCRVQSDEGYFGPRSVSWQVHREVTVLFGGARAMLMQAAHPLVVAGANQTGMYERNPWKRLQRTLVLQYALTFGTKAEAHAAAQRINEVHERINGLDRVTGRRYDALDPELLLWVHACLVESALLFERLTIGALDAEGRQRFHEEQMLSAELVCLPRERIPPTVAALESFVTETVGSGELFVTDAARSVAELFFDPPRDAQWRPVLKAVARLAFGTLPPELRDGYGFPFGPARRAEVRAMFAALRAVRPLLPPKRRFIAPYQQWRLRERGRDDDGGIESTRRSLGIRL